MNPKNYIFVITATIKLNLEVFLQFRHNDLFLCRRTSIQLKQSDITNMQIKMV